MSILLSCFGAPQQSASSTGRKRKITAEAKQKDYFRNYNVSLTSIMANKETRALFKKYSVQVCKCPESFGFLEHCEEFTKAFPTLTNSQRMEKCKEVIDKFIKEGSLMQINIDGDLRLSLVNNFNQLERENKDVPAIFFQTANDLLFNEFSLDVFPRFVRSPMFRDFVRRKGGEMFLAKFGVLKTVERIQFLSHEILESALLIPKRRSSTLLESSGNNTGAIDPEQRPKITNADVELVKQLCSDSNQWKLLVDKKEFQTYVSRGRLFSSPEQANTTTNTNNNNAQQPHQAGDSSHSKKGLKYLKCVGLLNYGVDDVLHSLFNADLHGTWDHNLANIHQVDYLRYNQESNDDYSISITYQTFPMLWPFTNRDFVLANSVLFKEQRYYIIQKSTKNVKTPEKNGVVRGFMLSGWVLQKVSEKLTRYIHCLCVDMDGTFIGSQQQPGQQQVTSPTTSPLPSPAPLPTTSTHSPQSQQGDKLPTPAAVPAIHYTKVFELMFRKRMQTLHQGILDCIRLSEQTKFSRPSNSYGLLETLDDYKKRHFFNTYGSHIQNMKVEQVVSLLSNTEEHTTEALQSAEVFKNTFSQESPRGSCLLTRVVYISKYNPKNLKADQIAQITQKSITNNKRDNITGMLLVCAHFGIFYQLIEGPPEKIKALLTRLVKDTRHTNFTILSEENNVHEDERFYGGWSMNVVTLNESNQFFVKFFKDWIQKVYISQDTKKKDKKQQLIEEVEKMLL